MNENPILRIGGQKASKSKRKRMLRQKAEYFRRKKYGTESMLNTTTKEMVYTYTGTYDGCYEMGKHN